MAGVRDIADFFEVGEAHLRDWANEHELPKVGNNVVFTLETAEELEADLASEESDDDEPLDEEPQDE